MRKLLLCLLTLCLLFASMNAFSASSPANRLVETSWLQSHLQDKNLVILDVRKEQKDYLAGHVPGALFVPWGKVRRSQIRGDYALEYALPDPTEITELAQSLGIANESTVVVTSDWSSISSMAFATRLAWTLQYYGIDALVLNGGVSKWSKEKLGLEQSVPSVTHSAFKIVSVNPHILATSVEVEPALKAGNSAIIDARAPEYYKGEKKKDYVLAAGHIPNAINIPGAELLTASGVLKSPRELERIFNDSGVTKDKDIIVYCDSGHLSTSTWFVLANVLGYPNVRQFDSSLHEWMQNKQHAMSK